MPLYLISWVFAVAAGSYRNFAAGQNYWLVSPFLRGRAGESTSPIVRLNTFWSNPPPLPPNRRLSHPSCLFLPILCVFFCFTLASPTTDYTMAVFWIEILSTIGCRSLPNFELGNRYPLLVIRRYRLSLRSLSVYRFTENSVSCSSYE